MKYKTLNNTWLFWFCAYNKIKGGSVLVLKECPKCGVKAIKIYTKYGYDVDFNIQHSNQNTICPNCKRKISYSVRKIDKETSM